uniref:Uncharacterized protein n=1 Tax=Cacopsylla melanoneura TaxID=428564 RepID=A0A8D8RYT7_9HEMI
MIPKRKRTHKLMKSHRKMKNPTTTNLKAGKNSPKTERKMMRKIPTPVRRFSPFLMLKSKALTERVKMREAIGQRMMNEATKQMMIVGATKLQTMIEATKLPMMNEATKPQTTKGLSNWKKKGTPAEWTTKQL